MRSSIVEDKNLEASDTNQIINKSTIPALTGLRFIAAFLVFFYHAPKPAWLFDIFPRNILSIGFGYFGVSIFFILSGFVITINYYEWFARGKALTNIKPYAIARFARIYPVFFFSFLAVFFTLPAIDIPSDFPTLPIFQLLLLQSWFPDLHHSLSIYGIAWSVSCEVFFYFLFPFVAKFLLPKFKTLFSLSLAVTFTILLVLGLEFYLWMVFLINGNADRTTYLTYVFPPIRFLDFFLGCLIALVYTLLKSRPITRREKIISNIILIAGLIFDIFLCLNFDTAYGVFYNDGPFIISFGFIIFYLARYPVTGIFKFLVSKQIVLLGEASYSFYLLHIYIILLTAPRFQVSNDFLFSTMYEVMLFAMIVLVSLASYKFIEVPARRFIRNKLG